MRGTNSQDYSSHAIFSYYDGANMLPKKTRGRPIQRLRNAMQVQQTLCINKCTFTINTTIYWFMLNQIIYL